jgi:hypothetical protein
MPWETRNLHAPAARTVNAKAATGFPIKDARVTGLGYGKHRFTPANFARLENR